VLLKLLQLELILVLAATFMTMCLVMINNIFPFNYITVFLQTKYIIVVNK
jgi:hypothetical protein